MKKTVVAILMILGTLGIFAQAGSWYMSVLPGYQFDSGNAESGLVGSLDFGYYFTDNVGLHWGLTYNDGNFKDVDLGDIYGPYWAGYSIEMDDDFYILEVGPEFVGKAGENGQIYGNINIGYTSGASGRESMTISGNTYTYDGADWSLGGAFGYRHFFNETVALNLQGTYHYLDLDYQHNFWDARIGISFKF